MRRLEIALTSLLSIAAVIVAAAVAKREFLDTARGDESSRDREISSVDWDSLVRLSYPLSDTGGTARMVVLADFECPACKRFHETLQRTFADGFGVLEVRYVHLPLSYHRSAMPSARLFECGRDEPEVSRRLADLFFIHQDSLGLLSLKEFALRAGATDPEGMARCASVDDAVRFGRIYQSVEIAERIKVPGTPAVVVDGVLQRVPPSETRLREIAGMK